MTSNDTKFMKEIGIEPCDLDKPFQPSLRLHLPEVLTPTLADKDFLWLLNLGVIWGPDPTPEFVPPENLREYLDRYPSGIRNAVEEVARELKLRLSDDKLDDLAQQIIVMFLEYAESEDDLVEAYSLSPPPQPGENRRVHFHTYFNRCMRAGLLTQLGE